MLDDREARLALSCVVEPGDMNLARRLREQSPADVWADVLAGRTPEPWRRRAQVFDATPIDTAARRHGLRFVTPDAAEWPEQLDALTWCEPVQDMLGAPLGLWVAGDLPLADAMRSSVAIVGSRAATAYGERVASDWAAELAGGATTVVSGGAFGIDAAAHRGALAEAGVTVAVLANGLDEVYPKANAGLVGRIRDTGLVVSEYPPGQHPTRMRFLARNRLIAALTQATLIVEGAYRSGARNTVTWATACGRYVAAVPGPVGNAQSFMPHRLIREGEATLVASVAHVRELVAPMGDALDERPAQPRLLDALTPTELAVYEALPSRGARPAGALALTAGISVAQALAALGALATRGLVVQRGDGEWKLGPVENRPVRTGVR